MTPIKNAITGYFVGQWDETSPPTDAPLELAVFISEVNSNTDETVDTVAYYDGDGTPEDNVRAIKKTYDVVGLRSAGDAAQDFIAGLEFQPSTARKIAFKQVRTDGSTYFGRATVSNINVTGGPAEEFAPFECSISWDRTPTITPAP